MIWLRAYLLIGLVGHKALWEILKRRASAGGERTVSPSTFSRLVKVVKAVLAAALVAQVVAPAEILPISRDPFVLRVAGVALFTVGLVVAMAARIELGDNWMDIEDARVRLGGALVATGVYRYVRHPIYTGDLLLLVGLELSLNSWLVVAVALLVPFVVARARKEERMLSRAWDDYDLYRGRTWGFVPFVL